MTLHAFDIETIPQSEARLSLVEPEHEPPGNIKDPDKIRAAIAEKAAKWRQRAALDATTGRVAMIGVGRIVIEGEQQTLAGEIIYLSGGWDDDKELDEREAEILTQFWDIADRMIAQGDLIAGFNCFGFDLPFLIQRSWILKVAISASIDVIGRYFNLPWLDLMKVWTRHASGAYIGLDTVARSLGLPGKNGDPTELPTLLRHDLPAAIAYLQNDLALTFAVANRMGIDRGLRPRQAVETPATPAATDY